MKTAIINTTIVMPEYLIPNATIVIDDGIIVDFGKKINTDGMKIIDAEGGYTGPGLIDIHTHGAGGHAFLDSSEEEVLSGCDFHLRHGTTTILPTVSAAPFDEMCRSVENIAKAIKSGRSQCNILGAHMEGPYLSAEQCGAQCPDFITPPVRSQSNR